MATSTLPSLGPKGGQTCDVTYAFSGVPDNSGQILSGYLSPIISMSEAPSLGEAASRGFFLWHRGPVVYLRAQEL